MEAGVGGEDEELPGVLSPSDHVLADHGLHDGVEASLGRVQVAGHVGAGHGFLLVYRYIHKVFIKL